MTKTKTKPTPKLALSKAMDIPYNKLTISDANVRQVTGGLSIEDLAEDIANRTLLQSLSVRAMLDGSGQATDIYEIQAGGRRYRALSLLVKQKRLDKGALIPCIVREGGMAAEDSLAENLQRVALHPLDQFRAFKALADKGLSEDAIATRFFVDVTVVRKRLRLASISPKLHDAYEAEEMTLEQLMAFTLTADHKRQEEVWSQVAASHANGPNHIRRKLTEGAVNTQSDRRARFIGVTSYESAGGIVTRDLFESDAGGWMQDAGLLERLCRDKLHAATETVRAEGWLWIQTALEFAYGHRLGLRRLDGEEIPISAAEQAELDELIAKRDTLDEAYNADTDYSEETEERLSALDAAVEAFEDRPLRYDPADVARAGAFVSIGADGSLQIERGFVRQQDEPSGANDHAEMDAESADAGGTLAILSPLRQRSPSVHTMTITPGNGVTKTGDDEVEHDDTTKLSDKLVTELTGHRTLALRDALANNPAVAFTAVLHAMALKAFYGRDLTCLEISTRHTTPSAQAPGLAESPSAVAIEERHGHWRLRLPKEATDLWRHVSDMDDEGRAVLFAHCASQTVNAIFEPWNRNAPRLVHGDILATDLRLDMAAAGWEPKADNYLTRVSKARILEAVREAKGDKIADLIAHLKKTDMAKEAERILAGTGWLPEILRNEGSQTGSSQDAASRAAALPEFLQTDDNNTQ